MEAPKTHQIARFQDSGHFPVFFTRSGEFPVFFAVAAIPCVFTYSGEFPVFLLALGNSLCFSLEWAFFCVFSRLWVSFCVFVHKREFTVFDLRYGFFLLCLFFLGVSKVDSQRTFRPPPKHQRK